MNSRLTLSIGGVLLFAAIAAGCGSGGSGSSSMSPAAPTPAAPAAPTAGAADVTITIVAMNGNNSYSPNPATVKAGQTVAWRNADTVAHTATADGGKFDTGTIAAGATSSPITMTAAGTFAYHCGFHPTMVASVTVTP